MKSVKIIAVLIFFFASNCKRPSIISLTNSEQKQIIAIQPLNNYAEKEFASIPAVIRSFYNKQVIVLKPIDIPKTFFNKILNGYSADSIIMLLSKLQNKTVVEIVGLTHEAIYTIKEDKYHTPYYDEDIFGMGYLPGNSCIVSDIRFMTNDSAILYHRLRNVIIHEVGHNAGLPHCSDNRCIMSETNGSILNLDNGGNDYCNQCKFFMPINIR